MLNVQGKGLMTTFWLLGEEGSEEGETLKEEEEEKVYEVEEEEKEEEVEEETYALVTYTVSDHDTERLRRKTLKEEEGETLKEEEVDEEEKACALVTYTVSDHDTERLMLNGDQNGFGGTDDKNLKIGKLATSTKV